MADYENIIARAARLCSTAEKCTHDIRDKLVSWGLDEQQADKALHYLKENKFIDDSRFAHYFVRDKLKFNKWGRIRISYALRQKQLPDEVIREAMETIYEENYFEILDQLILQKIRSTGNPELPANKAKILRFAAQKGFTSDEIFNSLDRIKKS